MSDRNVRAKTRTLGTVTAASDTSTSEEEGAVRQEQYPRTDHKAKADIPDRPCAPCDEHAVLAVEGRASPVGTEF